MLDATSTLSSLAPLSWLSGDTANVFCALSSGPSGAPTVQISQDECDRLCQLEFS